MYDVKRLDKATLFYNVVISTLGGLALIIMVGPVLISLLMSFTSGAGLRFPPEGLSLRWYAALFDPQVSGRVHTAAWTSLQIALMAVLGTLVLAVPAAIGIVRLSGRVTAVVEPLLLAPLVLPSLVYGLAALFCATMIGLTPSKALVVIGHIVVFSPLLYRATIAVASNLDPNLEDVSSTLGASFLRTLFRVLLPLLAAGIGAGVFLVFVQSFDNVSMTIFLADPGTDALPMRTWYMIEESLDPRVAAISGIQIAVIFILLLLAQRIAPLFKEKS